MAMMTAEDFTTFAKRRPSMFGTVASGLNGASEIPLYSQSAALTNVSPMNYPWTPKRRPWANRPEISETQSLKDNEDDENHGYCSGSGLLSKIIRRCYKSRRGGRRRQRVVEKNGSCNIQYRNISKRRRKYIMDFYTTLVDARWPDTLLIFAMSFYVTWLFFALIYYLICWKHGDLLPENIATSGRKPCVLEIEDFASAFLFSLETQHTIGYGSRQTTNECTSAMIVMSIQSVLGCLIQAFMVGLVFAKLSRPLNRAKTVVFSKQSVMCERDGKLCWSFRVGDMRNDSFIVGTQLSAKIIRRRVTDEGEMYHDIKPINILPETSSEPCVLLVWPLTIIHIIDEASPFYKMSASEMANDKFEVVVCLEGTIESTSMTFQARTSYLPHEILWGHRFEPMMLYRKDHNTYQVNFSAFNSTYEVDTPLCSSRDLEAYNSAAKAEFLTHFRPAAPANTTNTLKLVTPAPTMTPLEQIKKGISSGNVVQSLPIANSLSLSTVHEQEHQKTDPSNTDEVKQVLEQDVSLSNVSSINSNLNKAVKVEEKNNHINEEDGADLAV